MATDELEVNTPQHAAQALATPPSEDRAEPAPRLADGIELIGEFDGSGFKQAPYIARRQDGQVVQMPQLLYRLAEHVDGRAGVDEIAERFGAAIKRSVQADDARMLIEERLKPLGIVATGPHEDSAELGKVDPLLALKFRAAVVPDTAVRSLTTAFRPLFASPAVVGVVLALIGLDGWLFFVHGISQGLRHVLYQPALMLMLIAGVVLATAFHEIGHATACRYGGAKPGVMGVGVYIVWPAFYTDITDAYRLGKAGRLRTDLGGMYFNAIFALLVAAAYAATSFEPLLLLIVLQNFAIIQQALPLLRLDGYYILSDLTGVPDIFLRIRPVLSSLLPWRQADERVGELKSWVRVVVTLYVLLMVAFLAVGALAMVINLPRVTATGYDSAALHLQAIGPDFDHGQGLKGVLDVVETLFLILPAAGLLYTAVRLARRVGAGAKSWSSGSPVRQAALATAATAGIAVAVLSWWPNGEYRPIQPGERGTLSGFIGQVAALPSARPSLTAGRQRQLGGAPSERQLQSQQADHHVAGKGASRSQPPQSTTTTTTSSTATTTPTASSTTSTPTTTPTTTTTSTATTTVSTTPSSSSTATPAGGSSTTDSGSSAAPATTATTP